MVANALAEENATADSPYVPLGINWVTNFIARHPELRSRKEQLLDIDRASASHPTLLRSWFSAVAVILSEVEVEDQDVWNADEVGARMNHSKGSEAIFNRRGGPPVTVRSGNTQWTSVMECVNTVGRAIRPLVVHVGTTGVAPSESWFPPTENCPNFY